MRMMYILSMFTRESGVMEFRLSKPSDIDRVLELLDDGRKSLASSGIEQWQGRYPDRAVVETDIALQESYVVENEAGDLIASTVIGFNGEENYSVIENGSWLTQALPTYTPYVVIHRMVVDRRFKGCGAAQFMLQETERHALEAQRQSVRVDTHPHNAAMIRLLERNGYSRCGFISIAHSEGFDPLRIAFEKVLMDTHSSLDFSLHSSLCVD